MEKSVRVLRPKNGKERSYHLTHQVSAPSAVTLWTLHGDIFLQLLKKLHIKDLLNFSSTHPIFNDFVKNNPSIWQTVSFHGTWPSVPNLGHFKKAADHHNVEALVKLGLAFLYNEGLPGNFEGNKIVTNGHIAAEMFCKVESSTRSAVSPFTWLFIRPPWSVAGTCCKERVFNNMREHVQEKPDPSLHLCVAKTLSILDPELHQSDIQDNLQKASVLGSPSADLDLWKLKYAQVFDCATELESLRQLRQICITGHYDSQRLLCQKYVKGQYGGIAQGHAEAFVKAFVQRSQPTYLNDIYKINDLTNTKRYILLDWLIEVACTKNLGTETLHMAISIVDRFLRRRRLCRSKLQLLGVASLVLCARYLGTEIITIREAAWLTDNTYTYGEVVRMMGEITGALSEDLRVPICLDYVDLMVQASESDRQTTLLAEYLCELSLLQSDLGDFLRAQVAASCVLLARIILKKDVIWSPVMARCTGYSMTDLHTCTMDLYDKCLIKPSMVDYRGITIQAVTEKYAEDIYMAVASIQVLDKSTLCSILGVVQPSERLMVRSVDAESPSPLRAQDSPSYANNNNTEEASSRISDSELNQSSETSLCEMKTMVSGDCTLEKNDIAKAITTTEGELSPICPKTHFDQKSANSQKRPNLDYMQSHVSKKQRLA